MKTNWSGQKFFNLTLIKASEYKKRDTIMWEAECDCGNIIYDTPYLIKNGYRKSCGCIKRTRKPNSKTTAKDWSNQKFFRLTLIRSTDKRRGSFILWEAKCDCGNTLIVCPTDVKSGNTKSCGCYQQEISSKIGKITGLRRKHSPLISSAKSVWYNYKDCDFETFFKLSQQNCFYCNRPPHRTYNIADRPSSTYASEAQLKEGNFTYNGLDRIDSSKGHTTDNIVPCCLDCNIAKNDQSLTNFLNLIKMIYNNKIMNQ